MRFSRNLMPLFYQPKLTLGKRLCEGFVKTDVAAEYGLSGKPLNRQVRKVRKEKNLSCWMPAIKIHNSFFLKS
jgi:hypothetical protein